MVSPLQHCPSSCNLFRIGAPHVLLNRARIFTYSGLRQQTKTSTRSAGLSNLCKAATIPCPSLPWCRSRPGLRSVTFTAQHDVSAKAATVENMRVEEQQLPKLSQSTAYPFSDIERKWQEYWIEHKTFRTPPFSELDTSKPKAYILDMFPYPSGAGLHVGHPLGYTATDIMARYKRMRGYNVLHPMGWDSFGLPAETYAIQTGQHPRVTTELNIQRFRTQLQSLGFSYDWDREIATTEPAYYKFTQWIFLRMFQAGLAYQAEVPVNWCPALGTVLANEEVIDGKSERGDHPVIRMPMKQWMLRITQYADKLLEGLEDVEWSDSIKELQRNWIGRSEGAEIQFEVRAGEGCSAPAGMQLEVYTTRPDTLFGATYMVVAPELAALAAITAPPQRAAVEAYVAAAARKSELERSELRKDKTGVFTGSYAVNPLTGEQIPIWVADYVLGNYGSGAIMAVPGHDTRDFEFAQAFGLEVRRVVGVPEASQQPELPFTDAGVAVNCSSADAGLDLNGLGTQEAKAKTVEWLEARGIGRRKVNYKLRDWLFARQRYWGEPFPVAYPEGSEEPEVIPEEELPLVLPETSDFKPSSSGLPESPLGKITDWINYVDSATGRQMRRETSTMPQWAGSCWYFLRFIDPTNPNRLVDAEAEKYWMPVDLYVGGAEHATLHLLYSRFWAHFLHDSGVTSHREPFRKLVNQGMILGEVEYTIWRDTDGNPVEPEAPDAIPTRVDPSEVLAKGSGYFLKADPGVKVSARAHKMSKSRGNVINPDDVVYAYGADSLRLYEMFLGPLKDTKVWSTKNVEGVHRFLARVYRIFHTDELTDDPPTKEQLRLLHTTIKRVSEETEDMRYNTAIAAMMEFVNGVYKWDNRPRAALEPFLLLLSPYAPHLAEECWAVAGHGPTLAYEPWPQHDESLLVVNTFSLPVQVNGKMRGTVEVPVSVDQDGAVEAAKQVPAVAKLLDGKPLKKVIFVPGRILNVIVGK